MRSHRNLVIDGNAVYEIDIECQEKKRRQESQRRSAQTRQNRTALRKKPGD